MSKESYARGFVKAAEAHGVDPAMLAKYAAESTPVTDVALGFPGNILLSGIPGGSAVPGIANLTGLFSDLESEEGKRKPFRALIPGVSSYRMGNRIRAQVKKELEDIKKDKDAEGARPVAHAIAEYLGNGTSSVLPALAGAVIGGVAGSKTDLGAGGGSIAGALTGGGLATLGIVAGALAAAIKRRRTKKEQIEADKRSVLAKYLIPGLANYNYYKRIGRSQGDREESPKSKKNDGK